MQTVRSQGRGDGAEEGTPCVPAVVRASGSGFGPPPDVPPCGTGFGRTFGVPYVKFRKVALVRPGFVTVTGTDPEDSAGAVQVIVVGLTTAMFVAGELPM